MSLHKRCSAGVERALPDGSPNPLYCVATPKCSHFWHYDFRVNGRRYRASTETADKHKARDIEARERSRILDGRHGIRRQPDTTFRDFAKTYLRDHSALNKKSTERDEEIIKTLDRFFGPLILHEITVHRIEQFKRDRLAGTWRAHGQKRPAKAVKPATVNRELDVLKSIMSKAVEWGKLLDSPARIVKRLRVDNRRTRILSDDEQRCLLAACPKKLRAFVMLALITGARAGELLSLRWEQASEGFLTFLNTKNGKVRRVPIGPSIAAVLASLPKVHPWVFTNAQTKQPFTSVRQVFGRACVRAGIDSREVTLHTLRHTALSRMIAGGFDDYTVMEISGHSSTRMLGRYTHPTEERKVGALETFRVSMGTKRAQSEDEQEAGEEVPSEIAELLREIGGRQEARTPDLRVANAALSQLS